MPISEPLLVPVSAVIPNAGSLDELRASVDRLHRRYLDLAAAAAAKVPR